MNMPPTRFCWTRFGTESGEPVEDILARKEAQRRAHDGMFLWGIGNSVGPAIRELVRLECAPKVLFSPMRSKPKAVDVRPSQVFAWTQATTLEGEEWEMPVGLRVVSRGSTEAGFQKRFHYALVCRSTTPLFAKGQTARQSLCYEEMVNLLSKNKLGHSQVTAVVERLTRSHDPHASGGTTYPVGFDAELVYPYFVRLGEPLSVDKIGSCKGGIRRAIQQTSLPLFS